MNFGVLFQGEEDRWNRCIEQPYQPECLTIYLSNQCNLTCIYCFTSANNNIYKNHNRIQIDKRIVYSATRKVAQHCARKHMPLRVVFHGGGEPTFHWDLFKRLVYGTRRIADQFKIDYWSYIATNGVLTEPKIKWLIEHIDLIGLSVDGPPDIQDVQRPLKNGYRSSGFVQSTAQRLSDAGHPFTIRTTITARTVNRQAEIAGYLIEKLSAKDIHFEPSYLIGEKGLGAGTFVSHFIQAQTEAEKRHCRLNYSGVRLNALHGPYCDVLRNVLRLTPDGHAVNCFCSVDGQSKSNRPLILGSYRAETAEFLIDQKRAKILKRKAGSIPEPCRDCVIKYHCVRNCPDYCLIQPRSQRIKGLRCRINKKLAEHWLGTSTIADDSNTRSQKTTVPKVIYGQV